MKERRRERLESVLKREITDIILREINLPEGMYITVQDVSISKDGRKAVVFISSLKEEHALRGLEILNKASGFIEHLLGKRLKLRYAPRPEFKLSPSIL